MPFDPNILSTYLAILQEYKQRHAQAAPDATRFALTPPSTGSVTPNNSLTTAMAMDRMKQSVQTTPKSSSAIDTQPRASPPHPMILKDANKDVMIRLISAAKKNGIDPYTILAMAAQESGIGAPHPRMGDTGKNPLALTQYYNKEGKLTRFSDDWTEKDHIKASMNIFKEKLQQAKARNKTSEADILQAWNGYGKLGTQMDETEGIKSWYGIPVSKQQPIDMNINPIYGKRIIDIRENIIKKNPDVVKLINSIQ